MSGGKQIIILECTPKVCFSQLCQLPYHLPAPPVSLYKVVIHKFPANEGWDLRNELVSARNMTGLDMAVRKIMLCL